MPPERTDDKPFAAGAECFSWDAANIPASHIPEKAAKNSREDILSQRRNIYESYRDSPQDRRSGESCHTQGDPPHHAYPRGRPATYDIDTVGSVLLRYGRFSQTAGVGVVHSDEKTGLQPQEYDRGRRYVARWSSLTTGQHNVMRLIHLSQIIHNNSYKFSNIHKIIWIRVSNCSIRSCSH